MKPVSVANPKRIWLRWGALAAVLALPYVALMGAGSLWLWERGWFLQWGAMAAVLSVAGWWGMRRASRKLQLLPVDVEPEPDWASTGQDAWARVEVIANGIGPDHPALEDPARLADLFLEVVRAVARAYYPRSAEPELKVTVPQAMLLVERVAEDMREFAMENIPGSHLVTISDLKNFTGLAGQAKDIYDLYRVVTLALNPAGSLIREANNSVSNRLMWPVLRELQRELYKYGVRKAGAYAIELYGGRLPLDAESVQGHVAATSAAGAAKAAESEDRRLAEPFRVAVLGQVKAGKSSLINRLFGGEVRAATDVVPRTAGSDPYVLEEEGRPRVILFDTPGQSGADGSDRAVGELVDLAADSDAVLLVASAVAAARDPDRRLLDRIRARASEHPDAPLPPILVVLTHIDRLRPFAEWAPPYHLATDTRPKAQNIREAIQAVAADLGVPAEAVIPVSLADPAYNVAEGLMPVLQATLMTEGQRTRVYRVLKDHEAAQRWPALKRQALNTGKLLFGAARLALGKVGEIAREARTAPPSTSQPPRDRDAP